VTAVRKKSRPPGTDHVQPSPRSVGPVIDMDYDYERITALGPTPIVSETYIGAEETRAVTSPL
jgi:hypothetical protein